MACLLDTKGTPDEVWRVTLLDGTVEDIQCSGWFRVQASSHNGSAAGARTSTGDQVAFCAGEAQFAFKLIRFDQILSLERVSLATPK